MRRTTKAKASPPHERGAATNQRERGVLALERRAAAAVRDGHPWVYREALRDVPALPAGTVVELRDETGAFVGRGLLDPESALAVRVYSRDAGERLDAAFVERRLTRAIALRALFLDDATTAFRLVNGEGDLLPGLVIDRYSHVGVLRPDGDAARALVAEHARTIAGVLRGAGITSVGLRATEKGKGGPKLAPFAGEPLPETILVHEHGMAMEVDLARGQKTGAFLDQRENRRRVRELSRGRRVLNLFSYAGGFSVAAALGGASHVTSVDIAHEGHRTAQRSFVANGVEARAHAFVTADVFAFLEGAIQRGDRWDLVICDPPSFASNEKSKPQALAAYRRLHGLASRVLSEGAIFCAASCSSHVSAADFVDTLRGRTDDRRLVALHGPPEDHPTVPAWKEGQYLKFAVLA